MQNFSTTQATNLAVIAGAIVICISKLSNPSDLTVEDVTTLLMAGGMVIASITSFINRYKKGDLTLGGFRKN